MNSIRWFTIPTAIAVFAVGCERPDDSARQETAIAASEDPGYATEAPMDVHAVPDTVGGRTLVGNLVEMQNSGVTGTVTVTPANGRSDILLSLTGVQPNTEAIPTIEQGLCHETGTVVEQLSPVQSEATGAATETITVNRQVESFADGRHSIRIYAEQGTEAPPVACVDLPQAPATPAAM